MELEKARKIGKLILKEIKPYIKRGKIAGSIRREKKEVRDIDLVIQPKNEFMILPNIKRILNKHGKIILDWKKIIRTGGDKIKIDCYLANAKDFDILFMFRTGSQAHNQKLATIALSQGKQLKFSISLLDKETQRLLADDEKGIFNNLGVDLVEAKERD